MHCSRGARESPGNPLCPQTGSPSLHCYLLTPSLGKHRLRSCDRANRKAEVVTTCLFLLLYERRLRFHPGLRGAVPTLRKEVERISRQKEVQVHSSPPARSLLPSPPSNARLPDRIKTHPLKERRVTPGPSNHRTHRHVQSRSKLDPL